MNSIRQLFSKTSRTASSGFSLVELLLVIGFIAAGTAVALIGGRRYMDNVKVDDAAQAIAMITKSAHNMESVALSYAILDTNLAAVMPADLMEAGGAALRNSPWGPVSVASIDVGTNLSSAFKITYSTVPQNACAKFIVKNYAEFAQVIVNGTAAWSKADGALDPAVIATACASEANTIEFESLSLQGLTPVAPTTSVPAATLPATPIGSSTPSTTPATFTPTGSGTAPATAPTPAAPPSPVTALPFVPTPATTHAVVFSSTPSYPAATATATNSCNLSTYPSSILYSCATGTLTGSGPTATCTSNVAVSPTFPLGCPSGYVLKGANNVCVATSSSALTATEACMQGGSVVSPGLCQQDSCNPVAPPTVPTSAPPSGFGCQPILPAQLIGPPMNKGTITSLFGRTPILFDGQSGVSGEVQAALELGRRGAPLTDASGGQSFCNNGTLTIVWGASFFNLTVGGTETHYVPF